MDGGVWQATVNVVTKSQTRLSHFNFQLSAPMNNAVMTLGVQISL